MPSDPTSPDQFAHRHIGLNSTDIGAMLQVIGAETLDELISQTVPPKIQTTSPLALPLAKTESELVEEMRALAEKNDHFRSFIGCGYSDCFTPPVIQRNILENPGWYTQYTPYQAEIAQGRLEALLNFQTMVADLTHMDIANASLLDEATAAAEAMAMLERVQVTQKSKNFFVAHHCHPQTIAVIRTRAAALGIGILVGDPSGFDFATPVFGALLQYPGSDGALVDVGPFIAQAHQHQVLVAVAADLLALTLLTPPGELGADVVIGSAQRFGVPMGYGGPHAAFLSTRSEYARAMPGRLIGVSKDAHGQAALRMAIQTREQHIRREKATSNICTAQVLLAVMASMYAVYHGPQGLRAIATQIHRLTSLLAQGLEKIGLKIRHVHFFDTLAIETTRSHAQEIHTLATSKRFNFRSIDASTLGISLDEMTGIEDIRTILEIFSSVSDTPLTDTLEELEREAAVRTPWPEVFERKSPYLTHPVFQQHHSETEMLRYMRRLESRDLSLVHSMIPLGSCTMKLNATTEMFPLTFPGFARVHPFAPEEQTKGYQVVFHELQHALSEITGMVGVSLQPNAGSQGEYAGLLVIRKYHHSRGQGHRQICLIPQSAHGTNPASAVMAGYRVIVVNCDEDGNIDMADLSAKAHAHRDDLAALMVTYPSTHGVFEEDIKSMAAVVHECGGQVYMDGANMNAQVGVCRPAELGADVCHLNLHKTFCIPHGGGGPGMGPIAVAGHLVRFLPTHPFAFAQGGEARDGIGAISAAPYGSASILLISWAYITLMGGSGLTAATRVAILNANYIAERLEPHFPVLYRGKKRRVAHECILDLRPLKKRAGIEVEDVAKRLIDYGFHAPTVSFPVAGTLMIEPTESESKPELDRFCEAMIQIRAEIREIEEGRQPPLDNLLKNSPHTSWEIAKENWTHPYSRERAAFPAPWTRTQKFWPAVGRLNNVLGDRSLMCRCPPPNAYQE